MVKGSKKTRLVLDDSDAPAMVLLQQGVQQRCLARSQEPSYDLQCK